MNRLRPVCLVLALSILAVTGAACSNGPEFRYERDPSVRALIEGRTITYPGTAFVVLSDPHIFATSLGMEGPALEAYLATDRKLLRESTEIMESAIEMVKSETAEFVLISGDLTKDGERVSHELCASYLGQLEAAGKKVYVVPGNHDVLNGESFKYTDNRTERVPNVTPQEFAAIYAEYGYGEALYRDADSLSYVAEPKADLWLLALDSSRYRKNQESAEPVTDGAFSRETLDWIEGMLIKAAEQKKAVIAMLHHGIVEHYKGQEKYGGEYLLDSYPVFSRLLAAYGVQLVFTGHFHAQDITLQRWKDIKRPIFDIETGSLVTYPSPYRIVTIRASQTAELTAKRVTSIKSHPADFQEYARAYIESGIVNITLGILRDYGIKGPEAERLARQVAPAFVAHYAGDETIPPGQGEITVRGLGLRGWFIINGYEGVLNGLWRDLEPRDNDIMIDLTTGQWR